MATRLSQKTKTLSRMYAPTVRRSPRQPAHFWGGVIECTCPACVSTKRFKHWDDNNRALSLARAAGDETWYDRLLRARGVF